VRRLLACVLLVAAVAACSGDDDGGSTDIGSASSSSATSAPSSSSTTPGSTAGDTDEERQPLEGFAEVAFRIVRAGGEVGEWCALLADDEASRAQGLMEQHDLRGYDGMVFAFDRPIASSFYMRNTPLPLSIAFFDDEGALVSTADMEPCEDREGCPLYGADGPYVHALEVVQGDLPSLGVEPGSRLEVGGACPATGGAT
jgi:uncharacterized membrane protein (UPF0127 family)